MKMMLVASIKLQYMLAYLKPLGAVSKFNYYTTIHRLYYITYIGKTVIFGRKYIFIMLMGPRSDSSLLFNAVQMGGSVYVQFYLAKCIVKSSCDITYGKL